MIKIGVLGAGHLGKIHLRLIQELSDIFELVGFYDPNEEVAGAYADESGVKHFSDIEELIDQCDAIDIVTPTVSHFECAQLAIRKCCHLFIEKPVTQTLEEAKSLMRMSEEANVCIQVGHVERFNPAFQASLSYFDKPMFIETHRLAQFNPRGTDVPVVLDLMIHDIDIVLSVINSSIKRISASGVSVVSPSPDIANARIEFDNGCVANLTASRISLKNMRKSRFFQKDAYISVDFLTKEAEIVRMKDATGEDDPFGMYITPSDGKKRQILFDKPEVADINAIKEELRSFSNSIKNGDTPAVSLYDGMNALDVALQIMEKVDNSI